MKALFLAGVFGLAAATPAFAQHEGHVPAPAPVPAPVPAPSPPPAPAPHGGHQPPAPEPAPPATPEGHEGHDMGSEPKAGEAAPPVDHSAMGHDDKGEGHFMSGALGPYPMTREASGTAWQPDTSRHSGIEATAGDWNFMGHAMLNLVYDWQGGPRGDEMAFVSGMVMGSAQRRWPNGNALQLKAMFSPEPF